MALGRKARESVNTIEKLLGGVGAVRSWSWEHRKKHLMLKVQLADTGFSVTISQTASDARARMNQIADVKRELRKRGVEI